MKVNWVTAFVFGLIAFVFIGCVSTGASSVAPSSAPASSEAILTGVDRLAITGLTRQQAAPLLDAALGDAWIKSQSSRDRIEPVEILAAADGKANPTVWLVDYTRLTALWIEVSTQGTVLNHGEGDLSVPNLSPGEKADAAAIALTDPKVVATAAGQALVVNNTTGGSGTTCAKTRCIAVFLTPPNGDYSHLIVAVVDLAARQVIDIQRGA